MGANSRLGAFSNKCGISPASDVVRRRSPVDFSEMGFASFETRNLRFSSKMGVRFGVETMYGMRNIENNHWGTMSENLGDDNGIIKP